MDDRSRNLERQGHSGSRKIGLIHALTAKLGWDKNDKLVYR